MRLLLLLLLIFCILLASEWWWRRKTFHNELGRKAVHISVGSLVAFTPYFISWNQILVLSAGFLTVAAASKYLNVFKVIHSVQRPTHGEAFFALAVGGVALLTHNPTVYAVALLHMSLADGLAAIVGTHWGKANRYTVWGHPKSYAGTFAFIITSIAIVVGMGLLMGNVLSLGVIIGIALGSAFLENMGGPGIDNLTVPLFVALALLKLI